MREKLFPGEMQPRVKRKKKKKKRNLFWFGLSQNH